VISTARLRRAVRRETVGVDVLAALNLVGALLKYLSAAFLVPVAVALGYGETPWPFVAAGATGAAGGWLLERVTRGKERVGAREGFLVVALTWLGAAALGAIPYVLSGADQISHPVDAYFEAMSGFTTTGATVLTDVPDLSRSMLLWRQFSQWLGGMGIIVLALAVLPRLRVGGRQLFESEAPGPEVEQLATTIRNTARRLWVLYVLLTALMICILAGFAAWGVDENMTVFDAVAHSLTTLPTGGFSTRARGFEEFGAASQWTTTVFMILGGANFALLYAALLQRRGRPLLRDEELRLYVTLLVVASLGLAAILVADDVFESEAALRHAAFQAVSVMTTTGAASADFAAWPFLAAVGLVGLMFIGGCAGSTTGSVKVVRHLFVGRVLRRELDHTVHPELVSPLRHNGIAVDERAVRAVIAFVLLYVGIFAVGALVLMIDADAAGLGLTPFEAIAAAAATLGNVGPAFGFAGPMGSFAEFPDGSKLTMIVLMWIGRLEIIPVVVLFTKGYWRA
jgi:trk system potassium uptake protein TrkH